MELEVRDIDQVAVDCKHLIMQLNFAEKWYAYTFWLQAELLWVNCRTELNHIKDTIEDLNLCFPNKVLDIRSNRVSQECLSLSEGNVREFVNAIHPDLKLSIVDCLRRSSLPFRVSGEETLSNYWYTLESVSSTFNTHRRSLATSSTARVAEVPELASSSKFIDQASSPPPPPHKKSFSTPSSDTTSQHAPATKTNSSARNVPNSKTENRKDNSNRREIVIAVAVTASVTFLLAVLLFLCCNKLCRTGTCTGQNDQRPLLSLSMTDYSTGMISC